MNAMIFLAWMESASSWVGQNSLSVLPVLLAVWLVRRAPGLRNQARWGYVLGLLVLARLLLPIAPESRWSLLQLFASRPAGEPAVAEVPMPRPIHAPPVVLPTVIPVRSQEAPPSFEVPPITPRVEEQISAPAKTTTRAILPSIPASKPIPWRSILGGAWFAGALVVLSFALTQQCRFARRVRRRAIEASPEAQALLAECATKMLVRRPVRLHTLEGLATPVVFGLWRPRILLPSTLASDLTPLELRHVLLHEMAHIRCRDVPLNWIVIFTRALYWFHPLAWRALRRLLADRELLRDALVLRHMNGTEERRAYGQTLLKLATDFASGGLAPSAARLFHKPSEMRHRIAMITNPSPSRHPFLRGVLATLLLGLLVATTFTEGLAQEKERAGTKAASPTSGFEPVAELDVPPFTWEGKQRVSVESDWRNPSPLNTYVRELGPTIKASKSSALDYGDLDGNEFVRPYSSARAAMAEAKKAEAKKAEAKKDYDEARIQHLMVCRAIESDGSSGFEPWSGFLKQSQNALKSLALGADFRRLNTLQALNPTLAQIRAHKRRLSRMREGRPAERQEIDRRLQLLDEYEEMLQASLADRLERLEFDLKLSPERAFLRSALSEQGDFYPRSSLTGEILAHTGKLSKITLPALSQELDLPQAVAWLQSEGARNDSEGKGVPIKILQEIFQEVDPDALGKKVRLDWKKPTLGEVLTDLCALAGACFCVGKDGVLIVPDIKIEPEKHWETQAEAMEAQWEEHLASVNAHIRSLQELQAREPKEERAKEIVLQSESRESYLQFLDQLRAGTPLGNQRMRGIKVFKVSPKFFELRAEYKFPEEKGWNNGKSTQALLEAQGISFREGEYFVVFTSGTEKCAVRCAASDLVERVDAFLAASEGGRSQESQAGTDLPEAPGPTKREPAEEQDTSSSSDTPAPKPNEDTGNKAATPDKFLTESVDLLPPKKAKLPDASYAKAGIPLGDPSLPPGLAFTEPKNGLKLALRVLPNDGYRIGGEGKAELWVANSTDKDVKFSTSGRTDAGLSVRAKDQTGKEHTATIAQFRSRLSYQHLLLPPGQVVKVKEFTIRFEPPGKATPRGTEAVFGLAPGEYEMRAIWSDPNPTVALEGEWSGELESESVKFNLLAQDTRQTNLPAKDPSVDRIAAKLNAIRVPKVELTEKTLAEVLRFLEEESKRLDTTEVDESKRGVAFRIDEAITPQVLEQRFTRRSPLTDRTLTEALFEIGEPSGLLFRFQADGVIAQTQGLYISEVSFAGAKSSNPPPRFLDRPLDFFQNPPPPSNSSGLGSLELKKPFPKDTLARAEAGFEGEMSSQSSLSEGNGVSVSVSAFQSLSELEKLLKMKEQLAAISLPEGNWNAGKLEDLVSALAAHIKGTAAGKDLRLELNQHEFGVEDPAKLDAAYDFSITEGMNARQALDVLAEKIGVFWEMNADAFAIQIIPRTGPNGHQGHETETYYLSHWPLPPSLTSPKAPLRPGGEQSTLEKMGMKFPPGASASTTEGLEQSLIVRNTLKELFLAEQIVKHLVAGGAVDAPLRGVPEKDKPHLLRSPYDMDAPFSDVKGLPSGTKVLCPSTKRTFLVP